MAAVKDQIAGQTSAADSKSPASQSQSQAAQSAAGKNASVTVTEPGQEGQEGQEEQEGQDGRQETTGDQVDTQKKGFLAYFTTKEFYITLVLGYVHVLSGLWGDVPANRHRQVLAITNTATSTLSSLLEQNDVKIPAFQTFFNYILLTLIFTPYTIYRYGFKKWLRVIYHDWWKCNPFPPFTILHKGPG